MRDAMNLTTGRRAAQCILLAILSVSILTGCPADTKCTNCPDPGETPYSYVELDVADTPHVVIETNMGTMEFELWPDVAFKHCQSFIHLATTEFYDSLTFHRIVSGFVIQGGDPNGNGTGGPGYSIPAEFSDRPHIEGTLSMARSSDPNSAGSQFFVALGRLTSLDNNYTVFGHITVGLDVLRAIGTVPVTGERPDTTVYMERVFLQE
jgi:cyclophilin family peptidyl-prolyl cis-trans isomerase